MLTTTFIVIQVLSFSVMLLFVHQYKKITAKHEFLLDSIERGSKPRSTFESTIIIWIYIILTIGLMFFTTILFILTKDML